MALNARRLCGLAIIAAAIGCPKPVSAPVAGIGGQPVTIYTLSNVSVGSVVKLDGSATGGSSDPQGRDLTFTWSFTQLPTGSAAALNDAHSQTPSFVADVDGEYDVQLIVANAFLSSTPATAKITASKCGERAPVNGTLAAGPLVSGAVIGVGTLIQVSAPALVQPDNSITDGICATPQNKTLTYAWRMISQPASSTAALNNPSADKPSFTPDVDGDYMLRLVTTDSTNRSSAPSDTKVTASKCGANIPVVTSITPDTERPGVGVNIQLSSLVTDADASDACGKQNVTYAYAWSMPQLPIGSHAQLNSAVAQNPSFVPDVQGNYSVRLVATASNGRSSLPLDLPLAINGCGSFRPAATIAAVPNQNLGSTVLLQASVTDANATTACNLAELFSYAWAIRVLPSGSHAALNNPAGSQPSFTPDLSGKYTVELVVTDSSGLTSPLCNAASTACPGRQDIIIDDCGASAPTVTTTTPHVVGDVTATAFNAGSTLTVGAVAASIDNGGACNMGKTFTYAWQMTSRPKSSNAFVTNPTDPNAVFVADVVGNYQLSVVTTDSLGLKSQPVFVNLSTRACGTAAPTLLTFGVDNSNPNPGVQVQLSATQADADNQTPCSLNQSESFTWTVVSRPATSGATLSNPGSRTPTFKPDAIGSYLFSVIVTDSTGLASAAGYVPLTTTTCGAAVPTVAVTTSSFSVNPLTVVQLGATADTADNHGTCLAGEQFTYAWRIVSRPAGSSAVLSDPTVLNPTYKPEVFGSYQLSVVATATNGLSSLPAFVNVAVDNCALLSPVAAAPTAPGGVIGSALTLTPGAITDNNCLATPNFLYAWKFISKPAGSQSVLTDPTLGQPQFTPDQLGNYQVSLVVTDSQGFSSTPVFVSVVAAGCGGAALGWAATPIDFTSFFSGDGSTLNTGAQVTLSAHPTDPNVGPCGTVLLSPNYSYSWALVSAPPGSRAQLTSTTIANPTFVPDVPGSYQISAIVTDALGNTTPVKFKTVTTTSCGANVPQASILVGGAPVTTQSVSSYSLNPLTASSNDADLSCPSRFFNNPALTFSYRWSISAQPVGGSAVLSSTSGPNTTFEAFSASNATTYRVQLVVTASNGLSSAPASVDFTVAACGSHGPSITGVTTTLGTAIGVAISRPNVNDLVFLNASVVLPDSACTGGGTLASATWSVVLLPSGSSVSTPAAKVTYGVPVAGVEVASFNFQPDVAGTYQFSVIATDSHGLSSQPVLVTVSTAACGPQLLGLTSTVGAGAGTVSPNVAQSLIGQTSTVKITPSATAGVPDVVDQCVTTSSPSYAYTWVLSRPAASQATLTSATQPTTSLTPDVAGTYQLQLAVTDIAGLTSAPSTITLQAVICGNASPKLTSGIVPTWIASPSLPNTGDLVTLSVPTISDANAGGPNSSCSLTQVTPYQYRWSLIAAPAGSHATLTSTTSASPSFVPDIAGGSYQLAVTVTDALGNVSAPSFVIVTASKCGANQPGLTIVPATPVLVNANFGVALTGSVTDADNTCPAAFAIDLTKTTYAWSIVSVPLGGKGSIVSGNGTSAVSFAASVPGDYLVQTVATAANGLFSAPSLTTVRVSACGANPPIVTGVAATTGAGATSRPPVGSVVTLTASSFDADAVLNGVCGATPVQTTALKLTWSIVSEPAGSAVSFATAIIAGSSFGFTADIAGTYLFSVFATDSQGLTSAPVQVTVPTGTCGPTLATPPVPNNLTPTVGTLVTLSAGIVSDACVAGGTASLAWTLTSRPAGSSAALSSATAATPTILPDFPGTYTAQLVVTDSGGFSSVFTASFTAGGCTSTPSIGAPALSALYNATEPNGSPSDATAGLQNIYAGDRVQLTMPLGAPGLVPGSCGGVTSTAFTYQWTLVSRPARSQSTLSSSSDVAPVFVADVPNGSYQFMLTVKDGLGNTSAPFFQTLPAVRDCGARKPIAAISTVIPAGINANTAFSISATTPADPEAAGTACPVRFDNTSFSYAWTLSTGAQLSAASGQTVTVQSATPGTYALSLVVTAADGNQSAPISTPVVVGNCGANPPMTTSMTASQLIGATPTNFVNGGALYTNIPAQLSAVVVDNDSVALGSGGCGLPAESVTYAWSLTNVPAGSHAALLNPATGTPSFTPDVAGGNYTVQLITTDPANYSSTRSFTFSGSLCGTRAPVASAFSATQAIPGAAAIVSPASMDLNFPIALSATVTNADSLVANCNPAIPENDTYAWAFTSLPAGSHARLTGATTQTPSFTPDLKGGFALVLTTTSSLGVSATSAPFTINTDCGSAGPTVTQVGATTTPFFSATQSVPNLTIQGLPGTSTVTIAHTTDSTNSSLNALLPFYLGVPVQLATQVTDSRSVCGYPETTTYAWSLASQPAGSLATLNAPGSQSPSFTPDVAGEYDVQLILTDSLGHSSTSLMKFRSGGTTPAIAVGSCGAQSPHPSITVSGPVAFAAGAASATEPVNAASFFDALATVASEIANDSDTLPLNTVTLTGCGLTRTFSYSWTFTAKPAASTATIINATLASPSLTPDKSGAYAVQVAVSDGAGHTGTASVTINATSRWLDSNNAAAPVTNTLTVNRLRVDTNSSNVWAATSSGIWESTNSGQSWVQGPSGGPTTLSWTGLTVAYRSSGTPLVYASQSGTCVTPLVGRFDGSTWTALTLNGACFPYALSADPTDTNGLTVVVGFKNGPVGVGVTTDGFNTFPSNGHNTGMTETSPQISAVAVTANGSVLAGTDGATTNGGRIYRLPNTASVIANAAWTKVLDLNGGAGGTITSLYADAATGSVLASVADGRVYQSGDHGQSWVMRIGVGSAANDVSFDGAGNAYAAVGPLVERSTNNGANWTVISAGLPAAQIQSVAFDPTKPGWGFAGPVGLGFFKTFGYGQ